MTDCPGTINASHERFPSMIGGSKAERSCFREWGLGIRQLGSRVQGPGSRVWGFGGWGSVSRVWGFGAYLLSWLRRLRRLSQGRVRLSVGGCLLVGRGHVWCRDRSVHPNALKVICCRALLDSACFGFRVWGWCQS